MKKNQFGFTLVEVLAVITILGILSILGIASVSRLIDRSRNEHLKQQERTMIMAAQSYLGENRNIFGEDNKVELTAVALKDANYLKDDIKNSSGESCMNDKTYVKVTKISPSKYTYEPHICCGNDNCKS